MSLNDNPAVEMNNEQFTNILNTTSSDQGAGVAPSETSTSAPTSAPTSASSAPTSATATNPNIVATGSESRTLTRTPNGRSLYGSGAFESPTQFELSPEPTGSINAQILGDQNSKWFSFCRPFQSKFYKRVYGPLRQLLSGRKISQEQFVMIYQNIVKRGMLAEMLADNYRWWANVLDVVALYGGIFVSGLVVIQQSTQVNSASLQDELYWLLVVLSITVNLAVGTQQLQNYPELARIYETLLQDMDYTLWSYLTLCNEFNSSTHTEQLYSLLMSRINDIQRESNKNIQRALSRTQGQEQRALNQMHERAQQIVQNHIPEEIAQALQDPRIRQFLLDQARRQNM